MHEQYVGDSFDIVKRFWREQLACVASLYAHSRFLPNTLWDRFTQLTTIPVLNLQPPREARKRVSMRAEPALASELVPALPSRPFGLFLDPHTGIPLPTESEKKVSISHAPLPFILQEGTRLKPHFMICFDQSVDRRKKNGPKAQEQREAKREYLRGRGIASFYYVSHAPFLFLAEDVEILRAIRDRLIALGIPEQTPKGIRLQPILA
jgi:hypothetical protein